MKRKIKLQQTKRRTQQRENWAMLSYSYRQENDGRKRKYNNRKIKYDGYTFDSKKEFERYLILKSELKTGKIQDLRLQQAFVLVPSAKLKNEPKAKPAMKYIADFVYIRDGVQVVEDVKSDATRKNPVYRIKKHLMKSVHGIDIEEV